MEKKNKIQEFIRKLFGSMDTHSKNAFSARKLSAFVMMLLIVIGHVMYFRYATKSENWTLFPEILLIDLGGTFVFLGLTTYESIKTQKKDDTDKPA